MDYTAIIEIIIFHEMNISLMSSNEGLEDQLNFGRHSPAVSLKGTIPLAVR